MSFVNTPTRSFPVSSALGKNLRVKLASGVLALAGINENDIGVLEYPTVSGDEQGTVRLRSAEGSHQAVAAAAITAGALVYTAASGKVSVSASTAFLRGIALTAAAADGDVIEVLPLSTGTAVA